ncbi:MAG TPA: host attachment protein [Gemmatimonadales bacterium]|nr:host attachment protein [Gemmatimonadales bacterium]
MSTTAVAPTVDERVLTVVLDRAHARFFELTAAGMVELTSLHSPAMRGGKFHSDRQGGPGWGEHAYHDRIREEERRHYAAIAEQLERLQRLHGVTGFVLAGPGGTGAALQCTLSPALAERVIGTAKLNPTEVTAARVQTTIAPLLRQHQLGAERKVVTTMLEGLGTGRAENGVRGVLRALAKGQVRELLVREGARATGLRCATSGRLVPSSADCLGEGEPIPVSDLVAEASAEARRQGATVTVIRDPEAAKAVETLGALLRFG